MPIAICFFLNSYRAACFLFVRNLHNSIFSFIQSCTTSANITNNFYKGREGRVDFRMWHQQVLMINLKKQLSCALVSSPAVARFCHVELSSNRHVWTQHLWADRQRGRSGGSLQLYCCLLANKYSDVVNGANHIPPFNSPIPSHPPISKLDLPFVQVR